MTILHSRWGVKAAINVAIFFAFYILIVPSAEGQSISRASFLKNVSIKGQDITVEQILQQVSKQTRLYFIYSSNSVELRKRLSLSVVDRPLYELLEALQKSTTLTFRREDNYVVVKTSLELKPEVQAEKVQRTQPLATPAIKIDVPETKPVFKPRRNSYAYNGQGLLIPQELLEKNLLYVAPAVKGIDTSSLKKYFPLSMTMPRPKRVVFTSVGLMLNEYWGGIELRAGIPALYGVLNTGLMRGGDVRMGYGLGSSIPIKPRVTLNPVYTFGKITREEDVWIDPDFGFVLNDALKMVGKHHQLKLLFQIQASRNLMLHFGPSFNVMKTAYRYQEGGTIIYSDFMISGQSAPRDGYYPIETRTVRSIYYTPPPDHSTSKFWMGFEGGVSYLVKFSRR